VVQSQPRQIVCDDPISKKNPSQKWTGGVVQCVGPEFKPQYLKKKKKRSSKAIELERTLALEQKFKHKSH
jgi:hypothetical protein